MPEEERWTLKEIEMATGIKSSILSQRRKIRGIAVNANGYTLAEVKAMIKKKRSSSKTNPRKAQALKNMLTNDGAL